jgi:hypothetical protein
MADEAGNIDLPRAQKAVERAKNRIRLVTEKKD